MTETLLQELSNTDIDWLIASGQQQTMRAQTMLIQSGETPKAIYLLLDGALVLDLPDDRQFQLLRGEMVGETLLFNLSAIAPPVKAVADSIVLAIPQSVLVNKLSQSCYFSVNFYRSIALMISAKLRRILTMPNHFRIASSQPVKEALFVFSELRDSDVDWLIAVGHLEKLAANQILVQAGRPLDALHIILDGLLTLTVSEGEFNPFTRCFDCGQGSATQTVIDRLSKGEIIGKVGFLDFAPTPVTVQAVCESLTLSIPRSQLILKLQQDQGFACRFYRLLGTQLAEIWQDAIEPSTRSQPYHSHAEMDESIEYDDELNLDSLDQVAQGAARFNWMLKRLGVGGIV